MEIHVLPTILWNVPLVILDDVRYFQSSLVKGLGYKDIAVLRQLYVHPEVIN